MRAWWEQNGLGLSIAVATLALLCGGVLLVVYAFVNTPGLHDGTGHSPSRRSRALRIP